MFVLHELVKIKRTGERGMVVEIGKRHGIVYRVLGLSGSTDWYTEDELEGA